jgi:hypothetical protein
MTGWQIYEAAQDSICRFWNVTRSQIYLELGRLAQTGLIEDSGEGGPRERRPYRLTAAARAAGAALPTMISWCIGSRRCWTTSPAWMARMRSPDRPIGADTL